MKDMQPKLTNLTHRTGPARRMHDSWHVLRTASRCRRLARLRTPALAVVIWRAEAPIPLACMR